jgi:hypothetical protein
LFWTADEIGNTRGGDIKLKMENLKLKMENEKGCWMKLKNPLSGCVKLDYKHVILQNCS